MARIYQAFNVCLRDHHLNALICTRILRKRMNIKPTQMITWNVLIVRRWRCLCAIPCDFFCRSPERIMPSRYCSCWSRRRTQFSHNADNLMLSNLSCVFWSRQTNINDIHNYGRTVSTPIHPCYITIYARHWTHKLDATDGFPVVRLSVLESFCIRLIY